MPLPPVDNEGLRMSQGMTLDEAPSTLKSDLDSEREKIEQKVE